MPPVIHNASDVHFLLSFQQLNEISEAKPIYTRGFMFQLTFKTFFRIKEKTFLYDQRSH